MTITEADIRAWLTFNLTPAVVPEAVLQSTINKILELYPDDPALGSPFNTGNDTFGMPGFKRLAAICKTSKPYKHTFFRLTAVTQSVTMSSIRSVGPGARLLHISG